MPFRYDADVAVEDTVENIRFVAKIEVDDNDAVNEVRVHAVEIHPGVTKIVVRKDEGHLDLLLDLLNVDSSWGHQDSAVFVNGELIVTVPKGNSRDLSDGRRFGVATAGLFLFSKLKLKCSTVQEMMTSE